MKSRFEQLWEEHICGKTIPIQKKKEMKKIAKEWFLKAVEEMKEKEE